MRKALNFILLWLVLFLAFQAFACKTVQKNAKEEAGEAAVTAPQTNTTETGTGQAKAKAGSTETGKAKAKPASTETGKAKAKTASTGTGKAKAKPASTETGKSKQGTLAELKEEVITEAEKILSPSVVRKAILPSGVGLLILISLLSSRKEKKRR